MKIDPARQARSDANHIIIRAARATTTAAIVAYVAANPDQTESQVCYLSDAVDVLKAALSSLANLPIEQRPGIILSVEARHNSVRGLFDLAVQAGSIVRTGWRGGSAVYRVAS